MALWDIYFVPKFIIKVLNNVSCNFFYEDNNFLSLHLIDFAYLRIFDAVFKVINTTLPQKFFELNLWIPESPDLFPGLHPSSPASLVHLHHQLPVDCLVLSSLVLTNLVHPGWEDPVLVNTPCALEDCGLQNLVINNLSQMTCGDMRAKNGLIFKSSPEFGALQNLYLQTKTDVILIRESNDDFNIDFNNYLCQCSHHGLLILIEHPKLVI